jgi:Na+/melibiose symporter-like transporter
MTSVVGYSADELPLARLGAYGLFRMPLALLELPLFVLLPAFYSQQLGVSLALVGAVLLGARLVDALLDPLIGAAIDSSRFAYRRWILMASPLLALGFAMMLMPPQLGTTGLALWLALTSLVTYLAWSTCSIAYQAWGAALGGSAAQQVRLAGTREAFGLIGVLGSAALLLPERVRVLVLCFVPLLLIALLALSYAPSPPARVPAGTWHGVGQAISTPWKQALSNRRYRWLLAVFAVNGIASALPATLLLFFAGDVLGAPERVPVFLLVYFAAAALVMPIWVRVGARIGPAPAWLAGMGIAVLGFVWALGLGEGDVTAFAVVCALTGVALGADLAMPPALLAGVIGASGDRGRHEGMYFGVWNTVTKLVLAGAAGLGLPLLALMGYEPGERNSAVDGLMFAYAGLPCLIKTAAGLLLVVSPAWREARQSE